MMSQIISHWLKPQALKHQKWLWNNRGTFVIAPIVTGTVIGLRLLGWLQPLELALLDQAFRLRPQPAHDPRILIVGVTEEDLDQLKRWPTSDKVLAQAITTIRQGQPAAIGLDLYRNFPVEPGHRELQQVFKTTPNLIGIEKRLGDRRGSEVTAPNQLSQLGQVGINDIVVDSDGRLRRGLLYLFTPEGDYESFGLRLASLYLERLQIYPDPDSPILKWRNVTFPPLESHDGSYVGADSGGYQVLLNYRGDNGSFDQISLSDVLQNRVPLDRFQDRVVLIGAVATSLKDGFLTPYSRGSGARPLETPGVEIHANLVSHLLGAVLDDRPQIRFWDDRGEYAWIAAWGIVGTTLAWKSRFRRRRWGFNLLLLVILASSLPIVCYGAFSAGWWLPLLSAGLSYSGGVIVVMAHTAYRAGEIRQTFGRYLSDEVVHQLLESPQGWKLGGERRTVTMLLSDLRGFSAIAEQHPPEFVLAFLNQYLALMTEVITQYQGTIDEFMGDAILVLFGAPTERSDDAERAVACALAMQVAMPRLLERLDPSQAEVAKYLEMGIGVHTGEAVVGNIGSLKRAKYGIVGSNINLVSRIESRTVGRQVLISEATRKAIDAPMCLLNLPALQAKGFPKPMTIYDVQSIAGKHQIALPTFSHNLVKLDKAKTIECLILEDKQVQTFPIAGRLLQVSKTHALMQFNTSLSVFTDVKLNLIEGVTRSIEFYAKVIEVADIEGTDQERIYQLRFTFLPDSLRQLFQVWMEEGGS
jgi:adenylate cyclase